MTKFAYARVSTDNQDLEMQLTALKKDGCERFFSEKITGIAKVKPEFEKMMREVRPGDVIVVYSLSRLTRSLKDLLDVTERFKELGIQIKSLTEPIDTTSPMGEAFFEMVGVFSKLERSIIAQRAAEGSRLARERGEGGGRKPKLNDHDIAKLKRWYAEKRMSVRGLCNEFGIKKTTLYKYLNK